jgi:hypothetical protein
MASFEKSTYKDKDKWLQNKRNDRAREKRKRKELVESWKQPCLFCGEEDKEKIEFHHVNANLVKFRLSGIRCGIGAASEEVKKCWCLCKSCHKKLHQRLCDPLPSAYDTVETIT